MNNYNEMFETMADIMRHSSVDLPSNIDPQEIAPKIITQFNLAQRLADILYDQLELEEHVSVTDVLDALASVGLCLSAIEDVPGQLNYPSLAYFYSLKPDLFPEINQEISN